MPRVAKELTDLAVKRLGPKPGQRLPVSYPVGGVSGLSLQVTPAGGKSWLLRYTVPGLPGSKQKRRELGLGGYPTVTLKQAREKARELREQLAEGTDPVEQRKAQRSALAAEQARAITFEQAASQYIEAKGGEWKNAKHRQQWENTLKTYAFPELGTLRISDIDTPHILAVLEPIWTTKTETATRVRQRMEVILDWATARKYREGENPARWKGHLDTMLAKPTKIKPTKNHPALPYPMAADFMADLRDREALAARALEFGILTAARSGEVREASWAEFDLEGKVWTVPAERMKAGKEHRVPLSEAAVQLLRDLPRLKGNDLVFPAPRGGVMSDQAMKAVIKRMHDAKVKAGGKGYLDPKQDKIITPHGFRSTFRDWAAEATDYANEVVEMALAHTIKNKAEAAYRRGDLFEKRQGLMADWAAYCEG
ncbi:integrase [Thiohalobacter sp. COW1]|uniref:tyrosine-type recombinase/integrase n=1 Tax=Thiohalobacter sp. COW1 TaxID=2795687 RepID=UPI0019162D05|nr:site-specific integrase [Thiohalobacter sp. COW1]BCO30068.1 integrase [Thiohalobacter sp. COW1]